MGQLATSIAADYIGNAEPARRKNRLGTGHPNGHLLLPTLYGHFIDRDRLANHANLEACDVEQSPA